jgi:CopG family nickel-responsive transcriptional regulator
MPISRIGVSLEPELLEALDEYVNGNEFANRSQAIRRIVSDHLAENKWETDDIVAGAIIIVYDHHKRELGKKSTDLQHAYHDVILSTLHFHLDHDNCFEIIAVKGPGSKLQQLAEKLIALKGIQHGKLVMSKAGY